MDEENVPKKPGRKPRFSRDELKQSRADARAGIGTLDPPRLINTDRGLQNREYEKIGIQVLKELISKGIRFHWWFQHDRQRAALAELGRLADEFSADWAIAIAMLIDRAEPKGAMTAARAIREFRLAQRRARQLARQS